MRVLLASDGSRAAGVATDLVVGLDWPTGSTVTVLDVVPTGAGVFGGPWPDLALIESDTIREAMRGDAERVVADGVARLTAPGRTVDGIVRCGRPGKVIVDEAASGEADLIVVGSRGLGGFDELLLGSVSAEVVDRAERQVLVARRAAIRSVLLATDGSASSQAALEIVSTWPLFRGCRIRVVSVADIPFPWLSGIGDVTVSDMPVYLEAHSYARNYHGRLARDSASLLRYDGLEVESELREGEAGSELLKAAGECQADLIVVGSRGHTGIHRVLAGSVTRQLLHRAIASVLVVKSGLPLGSMSGARVAATAGR